MQHKENCLQIELVTRQTKVINSKSNRAIEWLNYYYIMYTIVITIVSRKCEECIMISYKTNNLDFFYWVGFGSVVGCTTPFKNPKHLPKIKAHTQMHTNSPTHTKARCIPTHFLINKSRLCVNRSKCKIYLTAYIIHTPIACILLLTYYRHV